MTKWLRCALTSALLASFALSGCATTSTQLLGRSKPLVPVTDVQLPGRTSRFDYQSVDPRRRLLFIAHLDDSAVDVIDLKTNALKAIILHLSAVHGVLAVPETGKVYATATGTNQLAVIDEKTLRVVARAPAGEYPDGIAYDLKARKVYISNELGSTDTVIDARRNVRVATIQLGGEAGNTEYDPATDRAYVNVQTLDQLDAIDPRTQEIVARYPLPGCKNNHGMYIDSRNRRAYIACDGNAVLLTFDLRTLKVTKADTVGDGPDVLAYNPVNKRLYVAGESGIVSIFSVSKSALAKLAQGPLGYEAHTVTVDPATGSVYFPLQAANGRPTLRIFYAGTGDAP